MNEVAGAKVDVAGAEPVVRSVSRFGGFVTWVAGGPAGLPLYRQLA